MTMIDVSVDKAPLEVTFNTDGSDTDKGFKFSWYIGDQGGSEANINDTSKPEYNKKFCGGTLTEMDCCGADQDRQCGYGQGDCDADEECAKGLRCGRNNCKEFRSWAEPTADCCVDIPKDSKPPEIDVTLISKIKNVNLTSETTIDSHDEKLAENKLMAWNVKSEKYIEFRFETSEDTRNAEPHRESWKKSGQGKKDKRHTRNKNKIKRKKLSKNMSKGTKAKRGKNTLGARKK